jgi:SAM-dependent MidA family methyltransferase
MDWVLHDPVHGAYGSGLLRIGPRGDFATSPSLGPDFAALLLRQIAAWLSELAAAGDGPLALVETGPGEAELALQLAQGLVQSWPQLAARTELVLVEPNPGMAARQRERLSQAGLKARWSSFEQLAAAPLRGVVLAHEVLDALAVDRICSDGSGWRQQLVAVQAAAAVSPGQLERQPERQAALRLMVGAPLEPDALAGLAALGIEQPGPQRPAGWCTELHPGLRPWLSSCGSALIEGHLLVIDYGLEAWRYYAPARSGGTLMAYRQQQACSDPLREPGQWDLTAHLCLESLLEAAAAAGWQSLGHCRQGQALLALGLAERLHGLQQLNLQASEQSTGHDLATLLARREAMLRLVDPHALGDFRWLAFRRGDRGEAESKAASGDKTELTSRRAAGAGSAESQPAEHQPAELELERFEPPLFLRQPDG